jgi:hypothetical protein
MTTNRHHDQHRPLHQRGNGPGSRRAKLCKRLSARHFVRHDCSGVGAPSADSSHDPDLRFA